MMQCFRDRTNDDHCEPTELQCDRNLFEILPYEILEMLVRYLDIPSIAIMSQTSKHEHGTIAHLVSDEKTWLRLVNQRFSLFSSSRLNKAGSTVEGTRMSKPKLYGGSTWKEAYRYVSQHKDPFQNYCNCLANKISHSEIFHLASISSLE